VLAAFIIRALIGLVTWTEGTSERSVNFYEIARRKISEDSHLHISRREDLKRHFHQISEEIIILQNS
jgi:hypothetical protein